MSGSAHGTLPPSFHELHLEMIRCTLTGIGAALSSALPTQGANGSPGCVMARSSPAGHQPMGVTGVTPIRRGTRIGVVLGDTPDVDLLVGHANILLVLPLAGDHLAEGHESGQDQHRADVTQARCLLPLMFHVASSPTRGDTFPPPLQQCSATPRTVRKPASNAKAPSTSESNGASITCNVTRYPDLTAVSGGWRLVGVSCWLFDQVGLVCDDDK